MGEDDSWEAALAVDASGISAILGLQGSGVKLRRGFAPPDSVNPTQVPSEPMQFEFHTVGPPLEPNVAVQ